MEKNQSEKPVRLRSIKNSDLEIFYKHQCQPEANRMAGFPPRTREEFMTHWGKIMKNPAIIKKTIMFEDKIAGNIVKFEMDGMQQIGYWLGKRFWGKGIATLALQQFLKNIEIRPLFAYVSIKNTASVRVLEKCGFKILKDDFISISTDSKRSDELLYILE